MEIAGRWKWPDYGGKLEPLRQTRNQQQSAETVNTSLLITGSWVRVPAGSPLQGRGQMTGGHAVGVIALGGTVSIFAINHLCREISRDHAFRAAMKVGSGQGAELLRGNFFGRARVAEYC